MRLDALGMTGLLFRVADRNVFALSGSRMLLSIPLRHELPGHCTAVNNFGWYGFTHLTLSKRSGENPG